MRRRNPATWLNYSDLSNPAGSVTICAKIYEYDSRNSGVWLPDPICALINLLESKCYLVFIPLFIFGCLDYYEF